MPTAHAMELLESQCFFWIAERTRRGIEAVLVPQGWKKLLYIYHVINFYKEILTS
jgi:hypothetical protein